MIKNLILAACLLGSSSIFSQIDTTKVPDMVSDTPGFMGDTSSLLDDLMEEEESGPDFEQNIFKGTRVINSNNTEMIGKKNLDYRISHRFGFINTGPYEFFGLDQAYQRMSFTYGITDLINVEVGRSSVNKMYDGTFKIKFMRQARGDKKRPLSIVYLANMAIQTLKVNTSQYNPYYFTNRLYYTHQLLFSKKITEGFSLQLMPTLVHRNLIDSQKFKNDVFSIGIAGRNKLTRKTALTYEYFYVLPNQISSVYHNSLSVGFDIETGGHVFQLQFTNSTGMNEKGFITETVGDWLKGDIHFGFNISRVFYIGRY
jgi:hypothetical protein